MTAMPEGEFHQPEPATSPGAALRISARRRQRLAAVAFSEPCILRVEQGCKRLGQGDHSLLLTTGDWVAIPAGLTLDVENIPDPEAHLYRASMLVFEPALVRERLSAQAPSTAAGVTVLPQTPALVDAYTHALRGLLGARPLPPHQQRHRLSEILIALDQLGVRLLPPERLRFVERLRALIVREPGHRWRSAELAARLAVSEATLRRRLAAAGTQLRSVLDETRMAHALGLLQSTGLSVQQIADACGYDSASRFAARFRARYGCAPSELRD